MCWLSHLCGTAKVWILDIAFPSLWRVSPLGPLACSCSPVRCSQIYPVAFGASCILMIKCVLLSMAHMTFCILASILVCLEVRDRGLSVLKLGWFWGKPDGWSPSIFLSSSLVCCSPLWLQGISVSGLCSPVFTPYLWLCYSFCHNLYLFFLATSYFSFKTIFWSVGTDFSRRPSLT